MTTSSQTGPLVSRDLAPRFNEIWTVGAILVMYIVADILFGPASYPFVNKIGSFLLMSVLIYGLWNMLKQGSEVIWLALFWFRLSTGTYFGFGVLAIDALDDDTLDYIRSFFFFNESDIFKINVIVSLSVFLILFSAKFFINRMDRWARSDVDIKKSDKELLFMGGLFATIGLSITYLLKTPIEFGWIDAQIANSIMSLSRLTLAGIFLLTLYCLKRKNARALMFVALLVCFELIFQLLKFAKSGFLMTLIFFLLAFLWKENLSKKRLLVSAAIVISAYGAVVPIVSYGREEIVLRYGPTTPVGFSERFNVLQSYFTDEADIHRGRQARQNALLRITYVNAAAFVIHQYDIGAPGTWPNLIPATFIPRFFWPNKPVISDVGMDIYELGTGMRTSAMGAGIFADTYWAFGWWGVIIFAPLVGFLLAVLTITCWRFLVTERWLYFPVILLGVQFGFRSDGHYLVDVVGGAVIIFGQLGILYMIDWYFLRPRARKFIPPDRWANDFHHGKAADEVGRL